MTDTPHFINGKWVKGTGKVFTSTNPADGALLWEGAGAAPAEVNAAMQAARAAFGAWAARSLEERLAVIEAFRAELEKHKDVLAETIARETGKPLWDCANEAAGMIGKIAVSVQAYHDRTSERFGKLPEARSAVRHKPHGIMAVFGPYNFPGHLPNGHIVPALIAGNTVVFKPSEITPLVSELTVTFWERAGIPAGVINLVQGERETGVALAAHPDLNGLLFTGSSETGLKLHQQFAGRPDIILALEMGGNNPLVVHEVSDIKAAAYHTIQSAFMSTGQRCSCARRLIIPQGREGDNFFEALVAMTRTITAGAYTQKPEPFMGPLVSERELQKIIDGQESLKQAGGKVMLELKRLSGTAPFVSPGIIDVSAVKDLPDREYFGPLLQVIRVKDFNEALVAANRTRYGLTAGLLSDNKQLFDAFLRTVHAGVINWNRPTTGASSAAPYGGLGVSGNHRPAAYYAADYCAFPVASSESDMLKLPDKLSPGLVV